MNEEQAKQLENNLLLKASKLELGSVNNHLKKIDKAITINDTNVTFNGLVQGTFDVSSSNFITASHQNTEIVESVGTVKITQTYGAANPSQNYNLIIPTTLPESSILTRVTILFTNTVTLQSEGNIGFNMGTISGGTDIIESENSLMLGQTSVANFLGTSTDSTLKVSLGGSNVLEIKAGAGFFKETTDIYTTIVASQPYEGAIEITLIVEYQKL